MLKGSCLCGRVTFTAEGPARDPSACHCSQCRKQSGHYWASASVLRSDFKVKGPVRWYAASGIAKRGFCPTCGSFLFWQAEDADDIGVALGALDGETGLSLGRHIFVSHKGDYYDIADGLPQEAREDD